MSSELEQKLKNLPTSPGVYIFYAKGVSALGGKGKSGEVIYVGKATSLKDRVGSYFKKSGGSARPIEMFIDRVADIEVKKTETVLEAYILEQSLIKKWQPKYNMDGKDDKSFSYVVLTKEDFPRFIILRKTDIDQISKSQSLLSTGKFPVPKFSNELKIKNLKLKIEPGRVFGPYVSKKNIEIALKILRKIFPYHSKAQKTEKGCLDFQIGLCPGPYAGAITKEDYAKNIRGIRMILEGKKKSLIAKMKKEMLELSENQEFEKAGRARNAIFALQHIQDVALISEGRDTRFCVSTEKKMRIEGYDISNISGEYSVGSMVVFDSANVETQNFTSVQSNKSQYRKFKIKTVKGANDPASMAEVLSRRFRNNWPRPDLIILDGGQGQLTAARRVLKQFHLEIPLLAVAKGPKRKNLDLRTFGNVPSISLEIIEKVRNEAHRFAVTFHKKLRAKKFME